jgi:hypothetical protein
MPNSKYLAKALPPTMSKGLRDPARFVVVSTCGIRRPFVEITTRNLYPLPMRLCAVCGRRVAYV